MTPIAGDPYRRMTPIAGVISTDEWGRTGRTGWYKLPERERIAAQAEGNLQCDPLSTTRRAGGEQGYKDQQEGADGRAAEERGFHGFRAGLSRFVMTNLTRAQVLAKGLHDTAATAFARAGRESRNENPSVDDYF